MQGRRDPEGAGRATRVRLLLPRRLIRRRRKPHQEQRADRAGCARHDRAERRVPSHRQDHTVVGGTVACAGHLQHS